MWFAIALSFKSWCYVCAKLTGGAPWRGRQVGRCPPKTAQFVPQNTPFWPKTIPKPNQNDQTKGNGCYTARARARDIYHKAHIEAVGRQHLHTLHMGYTNKLTAKTDYHRLVTKLVDEQRQAQRLQDTHTHLYQIRRQWYEQAKDDTRMWYDDAKLLLMVNDRYRRLSAGTNKLLDLHQQQATYMWQQQTHLTAMAQYYQDACKHKTTQYWQTTRPARQTIYLIRKRPREHWDPTLWEVPLQPLPKRHKTHWDPNEWEVPMT